MVIQVGTPRDFADELSMSVKQALVVGRIYMFVVGHTKHLLSARHVNTVHDKYRYADQTSTGMQRWSRNATYYAMYFMSAALFFRVGASDVLRHPVVVAQSSLQLLGARRPTKNRETRLLGARRPPERSQLCSL